MPNDTPAAPSAPLDALTARARNELVRVSYPRMAWLEPRMGPDGAPALDVLVVGAGQSGLAVAMTTAVPNLVRGLTRGLFTADIERHRRSLQAYDVPQAVLTDGSS